MHCKTTALFVSGIFAISASGQTQTPPNVSQVLMWSTLTNRNIVPVGSAFVPTQGGNIKNALLSVYTDVAPTDAATDSNFLGTINNPNNYRVAHTSALSSALAANIAVALSVIPLSSPTSGVILKKDPATGAELPVSSSLGPIFTQRAETIGKGHVYVGFSHQNYHFTEFNGSKLNGLPVLYGGGDPSAIQVASAQTTTAPATFNVGMDVRLSQLLAFVTVGVTNRFDVSIGLPAIHSAVASTAYNGIVYSGTGTDFNNGSQCWCVNTFTPGSFQLTAPTIGSAALSKSGFGDLLLRFKGGVIERPKASVALGLDLRLPTGDADNLLGTGTTSVKPFVAVSLYSRPLAHGIVFAPHFDVGWQFSGKSILGGTLQGTTTTAQLEGGGTVPVVGAPFTATKDYLPDVFTWGVGTEIALGRRNTAIVDILGNQIGWIHGAQSMAAQSIAAPPPSPLPGNVIPMSSGFTDAGRKSFGQYSGAFGYKVRIAGGLVASFQALVRFDDNALVARVVPLYGIGYGF